MRPTQNSGMKKMEVYICLNETNDGLVVLGDVYNAVARKTWVVPIQLPEVDGAFVIPSKADFDGKTYPVTEIAEKAFNKKELTGLIIPNTVTAIGLEAFQKCKINRIVLPDSVKKIGERAFSGCTGLTSVVIPASIKRIAAEVVLVQPPYPLVSNDLATASMKKLMSVLPNYQFVRSMTSTFFPLPGRSEYRNRAMRSWSRSNSAKKRWIRRKHESDLASESKQCANTL